MSETIEQQVPDLMLDEDEMVALHAIANDIQRGQAETLVIAGTVWRLRPTSQRQNLKMLNLDYDVLYWQKEQKGEGISRRRIKRLNAKIRKAYAKKAAYKVVGRWLWLIPFYYTLTWWRIYHAPEEVSAVINKEASSDGNKNFFSANLESSRRALELSTKQVGYAKEQRTRRMESAESMVKEDGLPKMEDSK